METIKLSRRDFTRAVVGAGAFYFGLPRLARVSNVVEATSDYPMPLKDHFVILVKNEELVGLRGFEEVAVRDDELSAELYGRYMAETGYAHPKSNNGEPLVVLVKSDESIGFKGFKELVVRDNALAGRLSRRFGVKVGG